MPVEIIGKAGTPGQAVNGLMRSANLRLSPPEMELEIQ
jgi:hypothetical protein